MNKLTKVLVGLGFLLMVVAVGCGDDDDCPACPESVTPLGHTRSVITLSPGTVIWSPDSISQYGMPGLEIRSYGAVAPSLDSAKVGDSVVDKRNWRLSSDWWYADAHWFMPFAEDGDPGTFMYEHGDEATIEIWGEGRYSSCQLKILNRNLAIPTITDPVSGADTIPPGGSDTVYWNTLEHVDYYAIMIAWWITSDDFDGWIFDYHYAVDTLFVVTGDMWPSDTVLNFNVEVTPFNGPDPRTGGTSWTGTLLGGIVFSPGVNQVTSIIVDQPVTLRNKKVPGSVPEQPKQSPEDIVTNVYKKYGM